jgi:hypothetical protein
MMRMRMPAMSATSGCKWAMPMTMTCPLGLLR